MPYRMWLRCCVLGFGSLLFFSGTDDSDSEYYDDMGYGTDFEELLDELSD